jgi:hypothetical protein
MHSRMERYSCGYRREALTELNLELSQFSHDGLVQLIDDLTAHAVTRGSWDGCVLSYRRGAAGSATRDQRGRTRTAFTVLWDGGMLTSEEVLRSAAAELSRRRAAHTVASTSAARARHPARIDPSRVQR